MPKWIDEKVLQKYFKECCSDYSLVIANEEFSISSCRFNEPFDRFPDCFAVVNGIEYPVEVEWLSSHYDHHVANQKATDTKPYTHDKFVNSGGFLVVFDKDCEVYGLQQVVIDKAKFKKWFLKNADTIIDESVVTFTQEKRRSRTHAKIWLIYVSEAVLGNWKHSKDAGVWGFTEGRFKMNADIADIRPNDLVIFLGPVSPGETKLRGWPRVGDEELKKVKGAADYIVHRVEIFRVSQGYHNAKSTNYIPIWPDETVDNKKYPHRFQFDSTAISSFDHVPFSKINFYTLRRLRDAIMRSPIEIDQSNFIELLRHFTA